jgi:uncharacterized membrane protein YccC
VSGTPTFFINGRRHYGAYDIDTLDELNWLNAIVVAAVAPSERAPADHAACAVEVAAAAVLERGADLLTLMGGDCTKLHAALAELSGALGRLEDGATAYLPVAKPLAPPGRKAVGAGVGEFITVARPELPRAGARLRGLEDRRQHRPDRRGRATQLGARLLGRQPEGLAGTFSARRRQRASAHVARNSVWLHNSVRGAVGLGLAVFVANRTGVQHSFWVVLGTLSVLRSNALNTGQNAFAGCSGTVVGLRHRRGVARRDRHQHDAPVVPAAGGGPARRGWHRQRSRSRRVRPGSR